MFIIKKLIMRIADIKQKQNKYIKFSYNNEEYFSGEGKEKVKGSDKHSVIYLIINL